jgi:hypothetical protein
MWLSEGRTQAKDVEEYVVIYYDLRGTRYKASAGNCQVTSFVA